MDLVTAFLPLVGSLESVRSMGTGLDESDVTLVMRFIIVSMSLVWLSCWDCCLLIRLTSRFVVVSDWGTASACTVWTCL